MKVAVCVPIYKERLSPAEEISLKQCTNILAEHDLFFVKPKSLSFDYYKRFVSFKTIEFPDGDFVSIDSYNLLLLHPKFYKHFLLYRYLLIYQLDAYVFKDDLPFWCRQGIDYIGAPWVNLKWPDQFRADLRKSESPAQRWLKTIWDFDKRQEPLAGNGGLSLRRVYKFYLLSLILQILEPWIKFKEYKLNEDAVWSLWASKNLPFFKVADFSQAVQFSFETNPRFCYKVNESKLPFGCHAWEKNDPAFWDDYIPKCSENKVTVSG